MSAGFWYYLDSSGASAGPFDESYLKGLYSNSVVTADTYFWAEGREQWSPLKDIPGLKGTLEQPSATAAGASPAAAQQSATLNGGAKGPVIRQAAAVRAAEPKPAADDELAAFHAEISAIEAENGGAAPAASEDAAAPASPPPEERSFVDDDGTSYVWDSSLRKFVEAGEQAVPYKEEDMVYEAEVETIPVYRPPQPDDEEAAEEAAAAAAPAKCKYGGAKNGGAKDGGAKDAAGPAGLKRGGDEVLERERDKAKRAKEEAEKQAAWFDLKKNTSVYVTGLPEDVTEERMLKVFGKCGLIKEGDDGRPRIKIYRDRESGMPKGDGLVTYLKEPSVLLACQLLDGAPFDDDLAHTLTVTQAKFQMKGDVFVPKKKQPKHKKKAVASGTKQDKALGWGGFDDQLPPTLVTVILKNLFHPDDFTADPTLKDDLEGDITSECAKCGPVDKVRVFYYNPAGVASVRFKTEDGAQACLALMRGRWFGGRQLEAALWDGFTNYFVRPPQESAEEQEARLARFAEELEREQAAAVAPQRPPAALPPEESAG